MRYCTKCGEPKDESEFARANDRKSGFVSHCKSCILEYYYSHKEQWRGYHQKRYTKHREEIIQKVKRWNVKHRQHRKDYLDKYHAEHVDEHKARMHEQFKNLSPEKRAEHFEKSRQWKHDNPDKRRAENHRRRARAMGNGGSFTAQEFKQLCERHGNVCLSCKQEKKLTPDHIIPIVKGGTSNISNIQPLCLSCNDSKGTKIVDYR